MITETLFPSIDLLVQEYVLVQAWKKTAAHIRRHNWYSDTLALDRATVNLPFFLKELAERLRAPETWTSAPLRMVPAPKGQSWTVDSKTKCWQPVGKEATAAKLRPLAHVDLIDQVAASAVMLCLADRVETAQGDPCIPVTDVEARKSVISYGNRLFCDNVRGILRHRWGSSRLYREYYQDYRTFLDRPETVIKQLSSLDGSRAIIVHSDLRQFYDRVRPDLLAQQLDSIQENSDDSRFFDFAKRVLHWKWHRSDTREVEGYKRQAGLADFSSVSLPQGLVAAGFFANLALRDFDSAMGLALSKEIRNGLRLEDMCRYVDDLRFVFVADLTISLDEIENAVHAWLVKVLSATAPGLEPSREKTKAALLDGEERPLVRQSRKMVGIQKAISGGFDAVEGLEILNTVHGLMRSQQRYSTQRIENQGWVLAPIADVRDSTVARFAAARFRTTFRSLRPLLQSETVNIQTIDTTDSAESDVGSARVFKSQKELDNDVRAFALGLIENWVEDPSNVRLLRIGLDLWPDAVVLKPILDLLRPFTEKGGKRGAPRRVAWYCLAEIFRAAATETGIVQDQEALPLGVDVDRFRALLAEEGARLISLPGATLPWYVKQQVYVFLAAYDPAKIQVIRRGRSAEIEHYRSLLRFFQGRNTNIKVDEYVTLAVLCRRAFCHAERSLELCLPGLSAQKIEAIGVRDPSFAMELLEEKPSLKANISARLRDDLCLKSVREDDQWITLADQILYKGETLRNEPAILELAAKTLEAWPDNASDYAITPNEVHLKISQDPRNNFNIDQVRIVSSRVSPSGSLYSVPNWCPKEHAWRFQLGYLLRFILTARRDFTNAVTRRSWRDSKATYRSPRSHWLQRRYGLFNGQSGFGGDWLPISDWVERLISSLVRWPGCQTSAIFECIEIGIEKTIEFIRARCEHLKKMQSANGLWLLPITAPDPRLPKPVKDPGLKIAKRPLRACIVQTVVPTSKDLNGDLTYSSGPNRKRHRNHLSTALAAVKRALDLRETHECRGGRLDWLILPELSVHPNDVRTHLVPFSRQYRTIILAGLTYEELFSNMPLVNSALWVIPTRTPEGGLQVITRRQGKQHLATAEQDLNATSETVRGFRPCQWLIEYVWSNSANARPLRLSAAICYDATDLRLASSLRDQSDVFAIPALNRDVGTFDQMALALHYHMFQMIIVVNNGQYGGSNAYIPVKQPFFRQVFHLHGQPQASIAFLEIDDIAAFQKRKSDARSKHRNSASETTVFDWKFPPAGTE